jgi:hypothetical protein
MINTILAVDNEDSGLGSFFTECLQDIESFESEAKSLDIVNSNALNDLTISLKLTNITKFIFLAFSHGSDDSLVVKGSNPYISSTLNIKRFTDSFFYACACDTGKVLGQTLINNGCASFIGYNDKFTVWGYNTRPFVECANYGYKLFLQGHDIGTIITMMKMKYDEHIDNYNNDIFGAADLLSNKNALVAYGNHQLNIAKLTPLE